MIKLIIGGIGSGKSVTAIKEIVDRKNRVFCNFAVDLPNAIRLKESDIVESKCIGYKKDGTPNLTYSINWDFWNKQRKAKFDIIIDEVHNVLHSRRSMTKWNTLVSMWLSQIRHLLDSDEKNHLYLISQRVDAIDISARELAGEIIYISKQVIGKKVWIKKTYFKGVYCLDKFRQFQIGEKTYDYKTYFMANPYFRFYDTREIIPFGEDVYL